MSVEARRELRLPVYNPEDLDTFYQVFERTLREMYGEVYRELERLWNHSLGLVATITANYTFYPYTQRTLILDPGAGSYNVDPEVGGAFEDGFGLWVVNNTGSTGVLTFDSAGLAQAVSPGYRGYFAYDGSSWLKIYLGS